MSDFQKFLAARLPEIMKTPELYVHTLDMEKSAALVIKASPGFYKKAVFLDGRVLDSQTEGAWVPLKILWQHAVNNIGGSPDPADFIFHTGHSGSTLISRLLDELPGVLGLREPLALRTLASGLTVREALPKGAYEQTFDLSYRLLTRRFAKDQTVIIKATSMCNSLISRLLSQNPANRGLLLYLRLEVYLANMLAKQETPDIDGFLEHRIRTLKVRLPDLEINPGGLSRPEKITLSWLTEAYEMARAVEGKEKGKTLLLDFDAFLENKQAGLKKILAHFGLPGEAKTLSNLLKSQVFNSYAKDPGHSYSAGDRREFISNSRKSNAKAIAEGLDFANKMVSGTPGFERLTRHIPLN